MELFLVTFVLFFISMLILVGIQCLRDGDLPTGCTPDGCRRCRKDCPTKASLDAQSGSGDL